MRKKEAFLAISCMVVLLSVSYYSCTKDVARLPFIVPQSFCDSLNVKYSTDIKPIMLANCATTGCHDGSGGAPLDLNTYADLKTFSDNGLLKSRVFDMKDMPPTGPLADSLLQKLKCWMDAGAQNN